MLKEKEDAVAISYSSNRSFSDDCVLFSIQPSIPSWKKVYELLFCGYTIQFQALLQQADLKTKTLLFENKNTHNIEQPNLYIRQQMSNILALLLQELKSALELPAELPTPQKKPVSIVVLVWNNLKVTIPCLLSVMKFTKHPFELIVVDNGSTEPVGAWVEKNLRKLYTERFDWFRFKKESKILDLNIQKISTLPNKTTTIE